MPTDRKSYHLNTTQEHPSSHSFLHLFVFFVSLLLHLITITSFHIDSYYYYLISYWQLLLLPHSILTVITITSFHTDSYYYYLIPYWQLLLLPHFILTVITITSFHTELLLLPHFILTVITITSFHTDSYYYYFISYWQLFVYCLTNNNRFTSFYADIFLFACLNSICTLTCFIVL
jgi:hypothetical protein